ncbi:MAG: DUF4145 domain-containing protein [Gammaproteobacteria bacterium]|nr:DUF4145 domain-containing protein [Gammaproteobacteria bacterium]MYL01433.1 DUF4145 domain-containing protein [Gammaproteobacteria bacterium]
MAELVANCPRCKARRITFDLVSHVQIPSDDWRSWYEAFCVCRSCGRSTTFVLSQRSSAHENVLRLTPLAELSPSANEYLDVRSHVALKDMAAASPPNHLPEDLEAAFREAATCVAVQCPNAAATMFRLCIDLATRRLLPAEDAPEPNNRIRRNLGLRLPWLFDRRLLPEELRELSTCIQQDGNDGAHAGTLRMEDAKDLRDFAIALLERLYTEPAKLQIAKERRAKRRQPK